VPYEYRLESLVLNNGFAFAPDKLTVIVGPNNSGKSRLLHDVRQLCTSQSPNTVVVDEVQYTRPSSPVELRDSYGIMQRFESTRNQVMLRTL
jgi:energy-coupling factor transporter ATP-binding protein EcfA2